jgi:hypothetical protein
VSARKPKPPPLPPEVRAEVQRILDRAARRVLAERLRGSATGAGPPADRVPKLNVMEERPPSRGSSQRGRQRVRVGQIYAVDRPEYPANPLLIEITEVDGGWCRYKTYLQDDPRRILDWNYEPCAATAGTGRLIKDPNRRRRPTAGSPSDEARRD